MTTEYKWNCKQCGFMFYGEKPPVNCPSCNIQDSFSNVKE